MRFPIEAPLRYRVRGERTWHRGTTVNISKSGVLFLGEQPVSEGIAIEMSFVLPVALAGEPGAKVTCHGLIVRASEFPMLAAKISGIRLVRP